MDAPWYWEGLRAGDELYVEIPANLELQRPRDQKFWCRVVIPPRFDEGPDGVRAFVTVRTTLGVFCCPDSTEVVFCRPELNEPLRQSWETSLLAAFNKATRKKRK